MADDLNNLRVEYEAWESENMPQFFSGRAPTWGIVEANVKLHAWEAFQAGAARLQPDAGVVSIRFDKAFCALIVDCGTARICHDSGQAAFDKLVELIDSRPASPVPASVRAAILEEAARECDRLCVAIDGGGSQYRREAPASHCAAAIRALKEVMPEQRGDSTDFNGGADAVDGERLDFMAWNEYWIGWNVESTKCRVLHQDEDGEIRPVLGSADRFWFDNSRAAIDAAIAAQGGGE